MSDRIFYAAAEDQNVKGKINSYVPSKFLVRNGMYVVDPVPGASQKANLYSDGAGTSQTDGKMVDPGNYIVVPANYTEQSAQDAAARLAAVHPPAGFSCSVAVYEIALYLRRLSRIKPPKRQ